MLMKHASLVMTQFHHSRQDEGKEITMTVVDDKVLKERAY